LRTVNGNELEYIPGLSPTSALLETDPLRQAAMSAHLDGTENNGDKRDEEVGRRQAIIHQLQMM
jgi:hypothetical protein